MIYDVKRPKLRTVQDYEKAAKHNQSRLLETMEKLNIKNSKVSPLIYIKGGGADSSTKERKPKTFKL